MDSVFTNHYPLTTKPLLRGRHPMAETEPKIDPRWAWEPYKPSDKEPWNVQRVGHLYRRAGFGATSAELDAGVKAGPDRAVEALLNGGPDQMDFDWSTAPLAQSLARGNNGQGIRAWWLYRMLYTPH